MKKKLVVRFDHHILPQISNHDLDSLRDKLAKQVEDDVPVIVIPFGFEFNVEELGDFE